MMAYHDAIVEAYEQHILREVESSPDSSIPLPMFTFDPISTATGQVPDPTSAVTSELLKTPSAMVTMSVATPVSS